MTLFAAVGGCFPTPIVVNNSKVWVSGTGLFPTMGERFGFNMDNVQSTMGGTDGCGKQDSATPSYIGALGPGSGVDNALPELNVALGTAGASGLVTDLENAFSRTRVEFAIKVSEIEDMTNDPSVQVKLSLVLPTFGTNCMNWMSTSEFAPYDRAAEGKSTSVEGTAAIVNGTLEFTAPETSILYLPVRVQSVNKVLDLPLRGIRLRTQITSAATFYVNVGAYMNANEFALALTTAQLTQQLTDMSTVNTLVNSVVDIPGTNLACNVGTGALDSGRISVGIGLGVKEGVVRATSLSGPSPGTCATQ